MRESGDADAKDFPLWLEAMEKACNTDESIRKRVKDAGIVKIAIDCETPGHIVIEQRRSLTVGEGMIDSVDVTVELPKDAVKALISGKLNLSSVQAYGAKIKGEGAKIRGLDFIFGVMNKELVKIMSADELYRIVIDPDKPDSMRRQALDELKAENALKELKEVVKDEKVPNWMHKEAIEALIEEYAVEELKEIVKEVKEKWIRESAKGVLVGMEEYVDIYGQVLLETKEKIDAMAIKLKMDVSDIVEGLIEDGIRAQALKDEIERLKANQGQIQQNKD